MIEVPCRIQRKRTAGWKNPENTVYCGRPGIYGNPYGSNTGDTQRAAVERFRGRVKRIINPDFFSPLQGKNLSCWCRLCERHQNGKSLGEHCPDCDPCHVDVIGEVLYGS